MDMKRFLAGVLCALLLLVSSAGFAEAKTFDALPEDVAAAFSTGWDGYTMLGGGVRATGSPNAAFCVMTNGARRLLCVAEQRADGSWRVTAAGSGALYQSGDAPVLEATDAGAVTVVFPATAAGRERLTFARDAKGEWLFTRYEHEESAATESSEVNARVTVIDGEENLLSYRLPGEKTAEGVAGVYERKLSYFVLGALPRSVEAARAALSLPPDIPEGALSAQEIQFTSGKRYEVYSGPGDGYERGAEGKAAVSTNDWIQVFGREDGWILIQYDISSDHMRFGYIKESALPGGANVPVLSFIDAPAVLAEGAFVTDDPLYSRAQVRSLAQGTPVTLLADLDEWAYIETTDGKPLRGFVPERAIELIVEEEQAPEEQGTFVF